MSSSSPEAGSSSTFHGSRLLRESSTAERIAKYTIASSLVGASITALYESTIGRAKAIREIQARSQSTSKSVEARTNGQGVGQARITGLNTDAAKFYRHNTALLSAASALNSGLVAFAFFNLRDYIVSPVLADVRRSNGQTDISERQLTWSKMRKHHLEDTAITGGLLGGALNAWKRGLSGIFPGAFTASIACTALQLIVNELNVRRIQYISRSSQRSPDTATNETVPTTNTVDAGTDTSAESNSSRGFGERVLALLGFTKVDEVEQLRRLKRQRDGYLSRIQELEDQVKRERKASEFNAESKNDGERSDET